MTGLVLPSRRTDRTPDGSSRKSSRQEPAHRDARPILIRMLDLAAVLSAALLSAAIAHRLLSVSWDASVAAWSTAGMLLGYLLADLAAGVMHWLCDTFFREETPVIGRAFIHPFREHHRDPLAMTRHGFLEVNGSNCLALVPLLLALWMFADVRSDGSIFLHVTTFAFALATFATNQFHKWAHVAAPPPAVRWLQEHRLILSPVHHLQHHTPPYRQAFCVTAGLLDPMLDRLRVFARVEAAVRRLRSMARGKGAGGDRGPGDAPNLRAPGSVGPPS